MPTVEEHQKLNKTISLKLCKFRLNFLDIITKLSDICYYRVIPRVADISLTRHTISRLGEASDEPKQHLSEGGASSRSLEAVSVKYGNMSMVVVFNIFFTSKRSAMNVKN